MRRSMGLRFNEAAGIHRRKRRCSCGTSPPCACFNEAAGIHRRKRRADRPRPGREGQASMRPPEFTGGNAT